MSFILPAFTAKSRKFLESESQVGRKNLVFLQLCFGVASLLLPAVYNYDTLYYQVPRQDILADQSGSDRIKNRKWRSLSNQTLE